MYPALRSTGSAVVLAVLVIATDLQDGHGKRGRTAAPKAGKGESAAANLAERYFAICDQDRNNSISFPEASASLGIDRNGFRVYDDDGDGLISLGEFRRRYRAIVASGGSFPPPRAKVVPPSALPATAERALEDFDKSGDRALELAELDTALVNMGAAKMDPEATLEQFDHDGSRKLESLELEELLALLKLGPASVRGPRARSIDELFGKIVPRGTGPASSPEPPRILGPVPSFRRLDIDGDGRVTRAELAELQRPFTLAVHPGTVLAALDADGDGAISQGEFLASMGDSR